MTLPRHNTNLGKSPGLSLLALSFDAEHQSIPLTRGAGGSSGPCRGSPRLNFKTRRAGIGGRRRSAAARGPGSPERRDDPWG
jgi:hypothetical protein